MDFKFIFSDNGTLSDYSYILSNYQDETVAIPFTAAEDSIFIGVRFPLNSFFLDVSVVNDASSVMSVSYWDGSEFRSVVELTDETSSSGVSLAKSGHVTFVPNKNYTIKMEDTQSNQGTENITGLGDVNIYERYWYKINFSEDLNALSALNFLGYLFSDDNDLYSAYPSLSNEDMLDSVESGKTSWEEQSIEASKRLVEDLIANKVITSGNQLLRREKLRSASIEKTAELIFTAFGSDFEDNRKQARSNYLERISMDIFDIDSNRDAILDNKEVSKRVGQLYR